MERPAKLGPEAVLHFLEERGGRVRRSELVQHFSGALGKEPEQRARFKELVNAVATVRTDPADGSKYVHLKRRFYGGPPSPKAVPPRDLPHISVTAEAEPQGVAPERPDGRAEDLESGLCLEAAAPLALGGPVCEPGGGERSAAIPGPTSVADDSRSWPPMNGGARKRNAQPPTGAPAPATSEDLEPKSHGCEEAEGESSPAGTTTPRSTRQNLRDLVMGSSPQLKRSICTGGSSPGGFSGVGRGRGGADSDSASVASSAEEESSSGGSVTLDPLEHAWMLSASDGKWDSLETLLTCEPGLLAKRDFITGFTCLHWAAKHGRQELLAMLVNFANKHQLPVNINARTSGGYTALHLAAMHGHVEVVKLLVGAYDADVDVRDYSGKKASQYLSQSIAEEIKNLVGDLDEDDGDSAAGSGVGRWRFSKVLPSHLIAHKFSHVLEDGGDHHHHHHHHLAEGWTGSKAKDPGRKASGSSSGRIKPRLNKMHFRTQIIHTTPSFRDSEQPLEEGEQEEEDRSLKVHLSSFKLRPKSNVFG
ncbi:sosondowah ankyrin repeat domain family member C [Phyllostomus discolor]|uniref:Ankyrin repeat domain-containing protein SOWAHC n=1 Tax=Phyllostomus discolor TaxID=89673 RepID=A0A6J2LRW2_9CHIR|nr:ankyrin repeat domain-containing protein SOWAHC [Phyllostomus discolor]KAF6111582.1 sosondowah ankyrin repeat domain family member C [Phyllostomus discolor]